MAENYSVKQVVEIIKNGSVSERVDVSRRYPILAQVALSLPDFAVDMLNAVKYCNARKIDRYYQDFLNGDVEVDQDTEEDIEEVAEEPKKKSKRGVRLRRQRKLMRMTKRPMRTTKRPMRTKTRRLQRSPRRFPRSPRRLRMTKTSLMRWTTKMMRLRMKMRSL